MEIPTHLQQQYSTVNKTNKTTVQYSDMFKILEDVIPNDGYYPFYVKQLESIGYESFMELVAKARAGSDTPARLFCWMLKHKELVR